MHPTIIPDTIDWLTANADRLAVEIGLVRGFLAADLFLSGTFGASSVEPYVSIENVANSRIEAGRTPATTLAAPRSARVGVRIRVGG